MFYSLARLVSRPSIVVDLGTANTRIYSSLKGETTVDSSITNLVDARMAPASDECFQFVNNRISIKPLRGGVIVDLKNASILLRRLLKRSGKSLLAPMALATAPIGTTERERGLLHKALMQAGTSNVYIIPESWAAAIGAGMDLSLPYAQLLVDIGAGITDMTVFRDGRIVNYTSVRVACSDFQRIIRSTVIARHRMQLESAAVDKLINTLTLRLDEQELDVDILDICGIDAIRGKRIRCCINTRNVINALDPVITKVTDMISDSLNRMSDKTYCEILETGILLTGGGAYIEGMDKLIASRTNMQVKVVKDPLYSVINGACESSNYWLEKKASWENFAWPHLTVLR